MKNQLLEILSNTHSPLEPIVALHLNKTYQLKAVQVKTGNNVHAATKMAAQRKIR